MPPLPSLRIAIRHLLSFNPKLTHLHQRFHSTSPSPSSTTPNNNPHHDYHNGEPIVPTSTYYDSLIHTALQSNDFPRLITLLHKRIRHGCFNTTNTFKFITATPTSLSHLDKLIKTISQIPSTFAKKNAFESLIARLCKLKLPDLASHLLDEMREQNLNLTASSFHPVLNALSRSREIDKTKKILEMMKEAGVTLDTTGYNFLLTAYCADGDVVSAAELLTKMRMEGLVADSRTYDAMVLGACRAGKVAAGVKLLRMSLITPAPEGRGMLGVLYSTPAHVINSLVEMGYFREAVKFVVGFGGRDKGLDCECFGMLASRLIKVEKVEEAKFVLCEMEKRGLAMGPKLRDFHQLHR